MLRWMVKDTALSNYLQACRDADLSNIEEDTELMKMFNTKENYKAHLKNIVKHIGPLDGLRICEIGGGYGGQAKAIFDAYSPLLYHIIDLPEVCELQKRYLIGLPVECFTEPTGQDYDLVISNYALSEIVGNNPYIDSIVTKCKHGYIACNTDFVKLDFKHSRIPDIKGERETNYILVW